jgi:tetratricopeptide (TPR) repeat protein
MGATTARADEPTAEPTPSGEQEPIDLDALNAERAIVQGTHQIRPRVSRYLSKAQKEVDAGNPDEAEQLLLKIQQSRLNILESAYVSRYLGFLAYNEGRPKDAITYFKQALDLQAMQVREDISMRFGIAQLYMGLEEWQKAIDWFKDGLRYTPEPDPTHYFYMALAYFQLQQYDQVIAYTNKAIETSPPAKEAWLRLLSAVYAQQEDYKAAIPVLEELVIQFPQRAYWVQLTLMYAASDDYPTALAAQQVAYKQGFLVESKELLRFARSYLYQNLSYQAAELLSKELAAGRIEPDKDAYELLANSWIGAREYNAALSPLLKAADLDDNGQLYVRLAQVHMQREQWAEAIAMLQKAVEKGKLEHPGNAQLLLGIANLNLEHQSEAWSYFQRARQYEDSRVEADRWIEHVEREQASAQS